VTCYSYHSNEHLTVPFESPVLTAANMKPIAFWDITPCSFVEVDQRFRIRRPDDGGSTSETSVYSTRLHGAISQKAVCHLYFDSVYHGEYVEQFSLCQIFETDSVLLC
jgi:hypothetical protein